MKRTLISACAVLCVMAAVAQPKDAVYLDASRPIEERVEDALSRMTLEEKVAMCHAQSKFSSPGVPRLGIPEVWTDDGPHGIRAEVFWDQWNQAGWTNDSCTAFPALTCLAATWDPEMSALYGRSIGEEARYRNKNVLLAPGVNIYRVPLNGRNFEYFGEDPFLASKMVVPYVEGVQSNGVAACVKHFALNNQEIRRGVIDVTVSDRALNEIYLPAFKAAVQEGKAWAIMGAYNKYKGQHCCHNKTLLVDILRGQWGFDGVVISDWGGVHDTKEAIYNGLDMEFGTHTDGLARGESNAYDRYYLARPFLEMIRSGEVKEEMVDRKVRNILRLIFRTTMNPARPYGSFGSPEHAMAGRKIAENGIVLLQNRGGVLPVDLDKVKKIAVIGENAVKMMTIGGGSSSLKVKYEVSPLDGVKRRVGDKAGVVFAPGYKNTDNQTKDTSGEIREAVQSDLSPEQMRAEAVAAAREADVVLYFGGLNKNRRQDSESDDRRSLGLPYGQDELIGELAAANPNTVVVLISGNAVSMPWVDKVPAIVQGWYCGSEAGNALASVLFGDVNPSGKLPFTFPVRLEDNGAVALKAYPGVDDRETYEEGIFVGYRWADRYKIKPLFCFGHGLSYTTFEYGKATLDRTEMSQDGTLTVSVPVKNTGRRAGAEIVQLYISDARASVERPEKELKGFKKVFLEPGEEQVVRFTIGKDALQFYDEQSKGWVAEKGRFEALIGASSRDIRTKVAFSLK